MFDDQTPIRPDQTSEHRPAAKDAPPAPEPRKDDAEPSDYHYTDWALI